jgi:hypothetical protein
MKMIYPRLIACQGHDEVAQRSLSVGTIQSNCSVPGKQFIRLNVTVSDLQFSIPLK